MQYFLLEIFLAKLYAAVVYIVGGGYQVKTLLYMLL
jgi:hypothetical protein